MDTAARDEAALVEQWIQAVTAAEDEEKEWREEAKKAEEAYRGCKESKDTDFNLFHSNIETLVPAIFNSTPVPDIRRRWGDGGDVGKAVADILERGVSFSIDQYDFDGNLRHAIYDMAVPGRGIMRVRYVPTFSSDEQTLTYESSVCEYVPWSRFTRGPSITWGDMPWLKFDLFLGKEEMAKLLKAGDKLDRLTRVPFTHDATSKGAQDSPTKPSNTPAQFKRAKVWEIWDKSDRKVKFICPEFAEGVLLEVDDPLNLADFWPVPRPMQAVANIGTMAPVCPLTIYRELLDELNIVTRRIKRLVKQCRPRGWYASQVGNDIKLALDGDDGELAPLQGADAQQLLSAPGGLEKAIAWFPLEPTIEALRVLVEQREQIKQTIYEVTGIADIIRGATKATETATAQQLKAQWGSLRIQSMQAEVARFVRDLFRIKVEIIARFQPETLMVMSDIQLLPEQQKQALMQAAQQDPQKAQQIAEQNPELKQAVERPSLEEVMGVLKSDKLRAYRIDIETDSTIRADQMRFQQQSALFLQGTAQFAQAIGPLVQEGAMPAEIAIELYTAFARQFKLGKSAEDTLDRYSEMARNAPPKDPNAGANAQAEADAKKAEMDAQLKQQELQQKGQIEQQKLDLQTQVEQAKLELERQKMEADGQRHENEMRMRQYEADLNDQREREKAIADRQARGEEARMKAEASSKPTTQVNLDAGSGMGMLTDALSRLGEGNDAKLEAILSGLQGLAEAQSRPRKTNILRGPDGRAIGMESA